MTESVDTLRFNTAISALMEFVTAALKASRISRPSASAFVRVLAPFAPHLAEELWRERLGEPRSIAFATWPAWDEAKTKTDTIATGVSCRCVRKR